MRLCHRIGPVKPSANWNTPEEIAACNELLSFDGVYTDVWEHRELLRGKDVTLFVVGDLLGKDNSFDVGEVPGRFCDDRRIIDLMEVGCKVGWHTWTHRDLTTLSLDAIEGELDQSLRFGPMRWLAYPYGRFDARVIEAVKAAGFADAFAAGEHGNGERFQRRRPYL